MSIDPDQRADQEPGREPGHEPIRDPDLDKQARDLVQQVLADPTGGLDPSVYETARLVALAPRLPGHADRIGFLLARQRPDGAWGGPDGYALVPTLSAVEALLAVLEEQGVRITPAPTNSAPPPDGAVPAAVERGLAAAAALLADTARQPAPPTVVAFMVIPALIEGVNKRIIRSGHPDRAPLPLPAGMTDAALTRLRADGRRNPLAGHYLELVGPQAVRSPETTPVDGIVGCSAAATAAWLDPDDHADPRHPSVRALTGVMHPLSAAVPAMTSLEFYERAWIATVLRTAGFGAHVVAPLARHLPTDADTAGAATAPGFAREAETSAVVLTCQALLGEPREPVCLWPYEVDTHFAATVPERWHSPVTNAHVIEAIGGYLRGAAPEAMVAERYRGALNRAATWLGSVQERDGNWSDKWHASPYFATMTCVLALREYDPGRSAKSVRAAVDWTLGRQRPDGSWGRWAGTAEETAYAVRILVAVGDRSVRRAVDSGCAYLRRHEFTEEYPPLWIGKELYAPRQMVRAAVLGALRAAAGDPPGPARES